MSAHESISLRQRIFLVVQEVYRWLLAVFVTSTVWLMAYNRDWESKNTWHAFLCTIGFAFFMSEAIALLSPGHQFFQGYSKRTRGLIHGFFMCLATIVIIIGVSMKIQDKTKNNRDHFTSNHGITGFTAFVLTICTFLGGFVVYYSKELYKTMGIKPVFIKNIHIFLGIAAYVLGTVSLCYGIYNYFGEATHDTCIGLIVILCIYVFLNLLGPLTKFLKI